MNFSVFSFVACKLVRFSLTVTIALSSVNFSPKRRDHIYCFFAEPAVELSPLVAGRTYTSAPWYLFIWRVSVHFFLCGFLLIFHLCLFSSWWLEMLFGSSVFGGPYILRLLKASGRRSSVSGCRQAPVVGVCPLVLGHTSPDLWLIPSDFVFPWLNFEAVQKSHGNVYPFMFRKFTEWVP